MEKPKFGLDTQVVITTCKFLPKLDPFINFKYQWLYPIESFLETLENGQA